MIAAAFGVIDYPRRRPAARRVCVLDLLLGYGDLERLVLAGAQTFASSFSGNHIAMLDGRPASTVTIAAREFTRAGLFMACRSSPSRPRAPVRAHGAGGALHLPTAGRRAPGSPRRNHRCRGLRRPGHDDRAFRGFVGRISNSMSCGTVATPLASFRAFAGVHVRW